MKKVQSLFIAAAIVAAGTAYGQTNIVVNSNNPGGDAFTYSGSGSGSQLIGLTGWQYTDVENGTTVGIDGTNPDPNVTPDNGSIHFQMPDNGTNPSGKADVEYDGLLGQLGDLTSLSYDWYKDSASTTNAFTAPAIRLLLLNSAGDFHSLVFEDYYNNGGGTSATDQWVHEDITANSLLWATHDGGDGTQHLSTLAQWMSGTGFDTGINANTYIVGINVGVGSGTPGYFNGFADNISIGLDNQITNYNFETQSVPEPSGLVMAAGGVLGLIGFKRRRRA